MSWVIVKDEENRHFCFGCNTSCCVFGPLCYVAEDEDLDETIVRFVDSLNGVDPRTINEDDLHKLWSTFQVNQEGSHTDEE